MPPAHPPGPTRATGVCEEKEVLSSRLHALPPTHPLPLSFAITLPQPTTPDVLPPHASLLQDLTCGCLWAIGWDL